MIENDPNLIVSDHNEYIAQGHLLPGALVHLERIILLAFIVRLLGTAAEFEYHLHGVHFLLNI